MKVTLYTREACHLCDDAKRVLREARVAFEEIDVDSDPGLRSLYGGDVPVLAIDGVKAIEHRIDAKTLKALVRSAALVPSDGKCPKRGYEL